MDRLLAAAVACLLVSLGMPAHAREKYLGRTAAEWASGLKHDDPFERVKAARALAKFGADAAGQVSPLVEALSDSDPTVRMLAVEALGSIGPGAAAAVEALEAFRAQHSGLARSYAEKALAAIKGTPASTDSLGGVHLDQWKQVLGAPDKASRLKGIKSAERFGAEARPLLGVLVKLAQEDPEWEVRGTAIMAIGRICSPQRDDERESEPALAQVEAALDDPTWQVRYAGAVGLGRMKHLARAAAPKLIKCLAEQQAEVRFAAAQALGELASAAAVPRLCELLQKDEIESVRRAAVIALGWIGKQQSELTYVKVLVTALEDPAESVRGGAAFALGANWRHAAVHAAIPELTKALADRGGQVRQQAAWALGHFGKAAEAAVPALQKLLEDPDPKVRQQAELALKAVRAS